ncbi:glycoside hydrolase family 130 protein [Flavivirga eckloniae]|nr:glycoside hydrolase family 130 protein [Flavivirga eckloniae]
MKDLAIRHSNNPILSPENVSPSSAEMVVECVLNPGVFIFNNKIWLLVRVAERTVQNTGEVTVPIYNEEGGLKMLKFKSNDLKLNKEDPRVINYNGTDYLTTISHLRLFYSEDGSTFHESGNLFGAGKYESYGIEDCRVSQIENTYYLSYTAVSSHGVSVGLQTTTNWTDFKRHGLILPPHNKDCALFTSKIHGKYYALHRPSSPEIGGNYLWLAESPDGLHWGNHKCIAKTRQGKFDSKRLGAGASPIKTPHGWLEIYHGATETNRYCLGALLLDLNDPSIVIARSEEPIMEPLELYEKEGFLGNVVFTNGHIVKDDEIIIYYGASDQYVCQAKFSINDILKHLT